MQTYDIKFIKWISDNISPAVARAFEIGILAGISYAMGAIISGELLSWNALAVAIITPVWAAINKSLRDKQSKNGS